MFIQKILRLGRSRESPKSSSIVRGMSGKLTTMTVMEQGKMVLDTTIHITEECNFRCGHCYMDSGPEVKTRLSKEEIFSLIDQLAEHKVSGVLLTGGEPFLHPDLEEIVNRLRKKHVRPTIIFTNGSWVSDYRQAEKRLKELKKLGCEQLKFSIMDRYHREFIDPYRIEVISRLIALDGQRKYPYLELNSEKDLVNPKGRGINLPNDMLSTYEKDNEWLFANWSNPITCRCSLNSRYMMNIFSLSVRASGEAYPCNWFAKSLGNIKTDPLSKIIGRYLNDEEYRLVSKSGPQELARKKGMPEDEIKERFLRSPCEFCHQVFSQ